MRPEKYISVPAVYRPAVVHPSQGREDILTSVVSEVWDRLMAIYRSFVAWGSAYEDENVDYQHEPTQRREQVSQRLSELSAYYFPRAVWLDRRTCKSTEKFIEKSEGLYSEFADEIRKRGYSRRVRAYIAERVSAELGPLRREAISNLQDELKPSTTSRSR